MNGRQDLLWPNAEDIALMVQAFAMRIAHERGVEYSEAILNEAYTQVVNLLDNMKRLNLKEWQTKEHNKEHNDDRPNKPICP